MCLLYISFVVGDVLAYYKVTACVNLITDIVYYWCWPLLTFFVLRCDSNYWRNVGRPLNCDAASRAVVRRLAGARNGEFAAVILFYFNVVQLNDVQFLPCVCDVVVG